MNEKELKEKLDVFEQKMDKQYKEIFNQYWAYIKCKNGYDKIYAIKKNDLKNKEYVPIVDMCCLEELQDKIKEYPSDEYIYEIMEYDDFKEENIKFREIYLYILNELRQPNNEYSDSRNSKIYDSYETTKRLLIDSINEGDLRFLSEIYVVRKNDLKNKKYVPYHDWFSKRNLERGMNDYPKDKYIYKKMSALEFFKEVEYFIDIFDYIFENAGLEEQ